MKKITNNELAKYFGGKAKVVTSVRNGNCYIKEGNIEPIDENLIYFMKGCSDISKYVKPILRDIRTITQSEYKEFMDMPMYSKMSFLVSKYFDVASLPIGTYFIENENGDLINPNSEVRGVNLLLIFSAKKNNHNTENKNKDENHNSENIQEAISNHIYETHDIHTEKESTLESIEEPIVNDIDCEKESIQHLPVAIEANGIISPELDSYLKTITYNKEQCFKIK